jgi:hypothetical protein
MSRLLPILLVCLVLSSLALAADEVHQGKVLLAKDGKITLQDKDGNSEVFALSPDCKISLDGKAVTLDEIPNGSVATVTVKVSGDKKVATAIEAKGKA